MDIDTLRRFLVESLDDVALSRGERKVLGALVDDARLTIQDQGALMSEAFALVRERLVDGRDRVLVDWLEDVVKVIRPAKGLKASGSRVAEALFSVPGERDVVERLTALVASARERLDICVFTITYDVISSAILKAHDKGVAVRIITDDQKSHDLGSDISTLARGGIPVRFDSSPAHMHHKFVLVDGELLATGSFNWTRSAVEENQENYVITDDPLLVEAFQGEFERLWGLFEG